MGRLTVISSVCKEVLARREFAIVGISPSNSYFSVQNIAEMLKFAATNFKEFGVFIPDTISTYTLQALGYSEIEANRKTRKYDNQTKNKLKQALDLIASDFNVSNTSIIFLSELLKNNTYLEVYEACKQEFNKNKEFRQGCLETSRLVLETNLRIGRHHKNEISEESLLIAVEYFLKELPVMLNSPKIQNKKSCVYIYTSTSRFLEQIYLNRHQCRLIDDAQGYAIFK